MGVFCPISSRCETCLIHPKRKRPMHFCQWHAVVVDMLGMVLSITVSLDLHRITPPNDFASCKLMDRSIWHLPPPKLFGGIPAIH